MINVLYSVERGSELEYKLSGMLFILICGPLKATSEKRDHLHQVLLACVSLGLFFTRT